MMLHTSLYILNASTGLMIQITSGRPALLQNGYKINKEYTALNLHRIKQSLYSNLKQGIYCTNNCECSLKIPLHYTFLSDTGSRQKHIVLCIFTPLNILFNLHVLQAIRVCSTQHIKQLTLTTILLQQPYTLSPSTLVNTNEQDSLQEGS